MDKKSQRYRNINKFGAERNGERRLSQKDGAYRELSDPRQGKARKELLFAARQRSLYKLAFAV